MATYTATYHLKKPDVADFVDVQDLNDNADTIDQTFKSLSQKVTELTALGGEPNTIEKIKVNGVEQSPGEDKSVNITVPIKVSELANDSRFQKDTEVAASIQAAIAETGHATFKKVDSLPEVSEAEENVLYLFLNTETQHYDIYAKVQGTDSAELVQLDDTTVDLSGYATNDSLMAGLAGKVDKSGNKVLSDNNYTTEEKQKLAGIEAGATAKTVSEMRGATSSLDGTSGLVPAPLMGQQDCFLCANGSWTALPASKVASGLDIPAGTDPSVPCLSLIFVGNQSDASKRIVVTTYLNKSDAAPNHKVDITLGAWQIAPVIIYSNRFGLPNTAEDRIRSATIRCNGQNNGAYQYTVDDGATGIIYVSSTYTCLTGDTLVTMADGTQKRLDAISVGDEVLSYDWNTMTLVPNRIVYTDKDEGKMHDRLDKWTFDDGTVIQTVHRHEFYNADACEMRYMDTWKLGEHACRMDGTKVALVSHEIVPGEVRHYKITGEKGTNYYANGLLTGDRECPKGIIL